METKPAQQIVSILTRNTLQFNYIQYYIHYDFTANIF